MSTFSIKIKAIPPKGYKGITYSGICYGSGKHSIKEAEQRSLEMIKEQIDKQNEGLKIDYRVIESKKIKDDFFLNLDKK